MRTVALVVPGMDCATEEAAVRQRLEALAGVERITIDLAQRRLTVAHSLPDDSAIVRALMALGMPPKSAGDVPGPGTASRARLASVAFAAGGVLALGSELVALSGLGEQHLLVVAMAVTAVALCGLPTLRKGLAALRSFTLNISFLMTIAVIGAACLGEWPEAAMVVFLFALAEWIEVRALDHARNPVRALLALAPDEATVLQAAGSFVRQRA